MYSQQQQQQQNNNSSTSLDLKELIQYFLQNVKEKEIDKDLIHVDNSLLDKEIRTSLFPMFHQVLLNPPSHLPSKEPHRPNIDYYANDGIKWIKSKLNVRMIIFNEEKKCYKLKTHKKDLGFHVMRRQTFAASSASSTSNNNSNAGDDTADDESLKSTERLVIQDWPVLVHYLTRPTESLPDNSNNINNTTSTTTTTTTTTSTTQNNNVNFNNNNINIQQHHQKLNTISNNNNFNNNNNNNLYDSDYDYQDNLSSSLYFNNNKNIQQQQQQVNSKKRDSTASTFNISSLSSSSILNLFKKKKTNNNNNSNNNNLIDNYGTSTTSTVSNSLINPIGLFNPTSPPSSGFHENGNQTSFLGDDNYFIDFTDNWSNNNTYTNDNTNINVLNFQLQQQQQNNFTLPNNNNNNFIVNDNNNNNNNNNNIPSYLSTPTINNDQQQQHHQQDHDFNNNLIINSQQQQHQIENFSILDSNKLVDTTTTTTTTTATSTTTNNNNNNTASPFISSPTSSSPSFLSSLSNDTIADSNQSQNHIKPSITSYSPDNAPSLEQCKIISLVSGFTCFEKHSNVSPIYYSFWAVFEDGIEILALPVAPGVLEFISPIWGTAAITHFHFILRENVSKNIIQQTTSVPFCFTPSDHRGKLKIQFDRCKISHPASIIPKFRHSVKHLDLSNNALTNVDFLNGFYRLESLILNNNKLNEHTVFPTLPELQNLDLSSNQICFPKAGTFTERLFQSTPSLQVLNLADNIDYPCPYKAPHHHYNYRIYIISRFPQLTKLDNQVVSTEERRHAQNVEEYTM
eukprot:gene8465-10397_t